MKASHCCYFIVHFAATKMISRSGKKIMQKNMKMSPWSCNIMPISLMMLISERNIKTWYTIACTLYVTFPFCLIIDEPHTPFFTSIKEIGNICRKSWLLVFFYNSIAIIFVNIINNIRYKKVTEFKSMMARFELIYIQPINESYLLNLISLCRMRFFYIKILH